MAGGRWAEVTVKVAPEWTELVAAALHALGAGGTVILGRTDEEEKTAAWAKPPEEEPSGVRAYFPADDLLGERLALLRARLAEARNEVELPPVEITLRPVETTAWEEAWKEYYRPVKIGRVVVVPSWLDRSPEEGEVIIRLDPGLAFGAGTHPTTQQSLLLLAEALRPGDRVLDLGTGSGILAIAAAALGAGKVLGRDLDPVAVEVARANVVANGLAELVRIEEGDLLTDLEGDFDLVLANLTAGLHLELLPVLPAHLVPGGRVVLAGIITGRREEVAAAAAAVGFTAAKEITAGEWVAFLLARR
ncbi:MAG: 50S ribosomal protein L11 methyltransferase [Firmicutes bacterium]|nr:50S ribosomal protein L11 methyltransferase [Bacillota bacterium]